MDRFESAPDAAFALRQVSGELLPSFVGAEAQNCDALVDTLLSDETSSATAGTMLHVEWFVEDEDTTPSISKPMAPRAAPPLAERWPDPHAPPSDLVGAGLGLYGLRKVPLIGRLVHRDALWSALRTVGALGSPRVVLLRGGEGTGKSRLAEWLCESALETGAALVLRAFMDERTGSARALGRMLAQHFGCGGLGRSETIEHLQARLQGATEARTIRDRGAGFADHQGARGAPWGSDRHPDRAPCACAPSFGEAGRRAACAGLAR